MNDSSQRTRTALESIDWPATPQEYRRRERTTRVGSGSKFWRTASADLMRWKIKTRSGFEVTPDAVIEFGDRPTMVVRIFGLVVREPVEVVAVVREPHRVGFSYRALPGHPVRGEEAFILHREGDEVLLTVRSLTRPSASRRWALCYPALLVAQAIAHGRYTRALR